jgi:hypothetical protein
MTGDSGGPLILKGDSDDKSDDVQVGLTSWGWDCGQQPGVYARVSEGYEWIRDQVCRISDNPPERFNCESLVQVTSEQESQQHQSQQQQQQQQQTIITRPAHSLFSNIDASNYFTAFTRPRTSLPEGTSCRRVIDPQVCCGSRDSSTKYRGQYCIPAPSGQSFSSGSQCEAAGWVEDNANQSGDKIHLFSLPNEDVCNALFDDRNIMSPSRLTSCPRMASKRACCLAKDDDGNPCIPSRGFTRFSSGSRCESSTFVATNKPDNAGTCW